MKGTNFDPITFEVIRNALQSITDEMMVTVQRTGRSPTTTQAFDFSAALCDTNGDVLDQGLAIPIHMGGIPEAVKAVLSRFPVVFTQVTRLSSTTPTRVAFTYPIFFA